MAATNLTKNEQKMIDFMADDAADTVGAETIDELKDELVSFVPAKELAQASGQPMNEARGTIASLIKKDLILETDVNMTPGFEITDDGIDASAFAGNQ